MRRGIALVELIFAITIMSIALLSLPIVMVQVKETNSLNVKQESIAIAASHVSLLMTYEWDHVNTLESTSANILDTVSGNTNLSKNTDTELRGSRTEFPNTRMHNASTLMATEKFAIEDVDPGENAMNDIDDFNEIETSLILYDEESKSDYVDQAVVLKTNIYYGNYSGNYGDQDIVVINNGKSTTSTNIKVIETTIETKKKEKLKFRSMSSNIGAYNSEVVGGF